MSTVNASGGAEGNLEEKIYSFFKKRGVGAQLKALEVAKGVGLKKAKDVNKALYGLQNVGRLQKTDELPPQWSLVGVCGPAEVPKAPRGACTPSKHEIKTALSSRKADGGVPARELARELNQTSRAVNAQLYGMLKGGEVTKCTSKDGSFLWKCADEDGSKKKTREESSDTGNESVIWSSDESCDGDEVTSHSAVSRFFKEYSSIEKLGEGGFGDIYKARQNLDKKNYAIKVVEYDTHALREVEALAELQHPNIVRYCTTWTQTSPPEPRKSISDEEDESESSGESVKSNSPRKYLYIQMEFCGGGTLTSWITKKNQKRIRNNNEALDIFQKIMDGVVYIHSREHIHRDLKPDNILFGSDRAVKIGDFGLVTTIKDKNGASVKRTEGTGTETYMSPEQEKCLTEYDEKVDIFPLGLIFFELLWIIGTGMERAMLWKDLRAGKPAEEFCKEYPSEHVLIRKMLSEAPEHRPGAKDISERLLIFIGNQARSPFPKTC